MKLKLVCGSLVVIGAAVSTDYIFRRLMLGHRMGWGHLFGLLSLLTGLILWNVIDWQRLRTGA